MAPGGGVGAGGAGAIGVGSSAVGPAGDAAVEMDGISDRRCVACRKRTRQGTPSLRCQGCGVRCHKMWRCSGLPRAQLDPSTWACRSCVSSGRVAPSRPAETLAGRRVLGAHEARVGVPYGRREPCLKCGTGVPPCRRPLRCSACRRPVHKMCSGLTRAQWEDDAMSLAWRCEGCEPHARETPEARARPFGVGSRGRIPAEFISRGCLRILQWNADGVTLKLPELESFLTTHRVDICLLQESKLSAGRRTPRLSGYSVVRRDRGTSGQGGAPRGGGLLTFIKEDIAFREVELVRDHPGSILETLGVEVVTGDGSGLSILNVYCPPIRVLPGETRTAGFDPSVLPSGRRVVIGGDVNAHSPLWDDSQPSDEMGEALEQWLLESQMTVLNDGSPTRVNRGTGGGSAPDLTVVHSSLVGRAKWAVSESFGSDHSAMLVELECGVCARPSPSPEWGWCWRSADWPAFTAEVERRLSQATADLADSDLDTRVEFLCSVTLESARRHVGRRQVDRNRKTWMTGEVRQAIRERNALRRQIGSRREAWIEACRRVRELIREAKQRKWRHFVEELERDTDCAKVWRVIRSLSDASQAGGARNEILAHNGKEYLPGGQKAELFARHYASVSRLRLSKPERARARAARRRVGRLSEGEDEGQESEPFSMDELERALHLMKARSAGGADGVAPRFLKAFGPVARQFLLDCFNTSWSTGHCPQAWRNGVIIPLLKSGKPASKVESYRPVCLTSCLAKTLERMVASRLQHMAETSGWWCPEQAGFRKLRCTEDQVLRLTQSISDGFQSRPAQRTVVALLDFSKAYDTVWREELLGDLVEAGVPKRFVLWLRGFLRNRQACVRIDGVQGRYRCFRQGLPQGSVLAPLLFLFYINSLRAVVPRDVCVSLYADDVVVWAQARAKERAAALVEEAVQAVALWSFRKKLQLSAGKCVTAFFSSDPREASWQPVVRVEGQVLRFDPHPSFLGVSLDRTLSFRHHAVSVASRAASRCRVLAALSGQEWGWDRQSLVRVFLSFIRPLLDYCAAGWQPWLAASNLAVLERAQNRALRWVTGQCRTTPVEALTLEAGVPQYRTVSRRLCVVAYERAMRLPADHPRRIAASSSITHRTKRASSWRREAEQLSAALGLSDMEREPMFLTGPAPWESRGDGWSVCEELPGGLEKSASPVELRQAAEAAVDAYDCRLVIYTDGSVAASLRRGGSAAVVTIGPRTDSRVVAVRRKDIDGVTCSFEAELLAVQLALHWLRETPGTEAALICTDSRALVTALGTARVSDRVGVEIIRSLLSQSERRVFLQWVPGHCGLAGNELADRAAGEVCGGGVPDDVRSDDDCRCGVSLSSVKALVARVVSDPPPSHDRVRAVYRPPPDDWGGSLSLLSPSHLSRAEAVLLAQLRSGHCPKLAAYSATFAGGSGGTCSFCMLEPQTLEHWLQVCPALLPRRVRFFGGPSPPLSVLLQDPRAVLAYARESIWPP